MKKIKAIVYVAGIAGLISLQTQNLIFASSCHGGGGSSRSRPEEYQTKKKKESRPVKITRIELLPKFTVKGKMTCTGSFLFRKGYHDNDEKCKNSAIIVKEVAECDKSGLEDCPFENKLFHILLNKNNKKLLYSKKFQNAKVAINGRFYLEERVMEVLSFRLLSEEEKMKQE